MGFLLQVWWKRVAVLCADAKRKARVFPAGKHREAENAKDPPLQRLRVLGDKRVAIAEEKARRKRVCLGDTFCSGHGNGDVKSPLQDRCKCPEPKFAADRLAGTRDALPSTMARLASRIFLTAHREIVRREKLFQGEAAKVSAGELRLNRAQPEPLAAVGKHLLDAGDVARTDQRELFELTHAAGTFGTGKVALGGVAANDFASGGDFKAFFCTGMALELEFWFR
jgi:hypothetical protein